MCDVDEGPEFYHESCHRAVKAHRCAACGEGVLAGERYVRIVGRWYGEFATYKQCLRCHEMMHALGQLTGERVDICLDCGEEALAPGSELEYLAFLSRGEIQALYKGATAENPRGPRRLTSSSWAGTHDMPTPAAMDADSGPLCGCGAPSTTEAGLCCICAEPLLFRHRGQEG
jgi:hypothetical protein